ncbi:signal peptide peptidase [Dictyocaulus viviparus]|uniref:Signal peptide peptidase n=1 Tax=Dictyocaulus viviparus TaxID=29172 RepID=A0A0D8YB43_DICVI|nr:signal peptide peptidase [Dictyocaulus viviparus]
MYSLWLLLAFLPNLIEGRRLRASGYTSSYVFLTVTNLETKKEVQLCANYLQFKIRRIAEDVEKAQPVGLSFWRNRFNETRVCPLPSGAEKTLRYNGTAVPLLYRIDDDGTSCTKPFIDDVSGFRNASQFEGIVENKDLSKLQLKFHRPLPRVVDFSIVIICLLALGSVAGGGVWAFFRHRAGKDKILASLSTPTCSSNYSSSSREDNKRKCLAEHYSSLAIVVLMIILVAVLMIGFFLRPLLVFIFNILLVIFGTVSVYGCTMAVLSCCSLCECCNSRLFVTSFEHRWLPKGRPNVLQFIVFILSLSLCVTWFVYRRAPYAFILLDFINVTLCLEILKTLRLPSLKWITSLMLCMFVYDIVMVFGTPYITRNGCSIMLEVATGIDCSSGDEGYPMPPIDAISPEKVPHFDLMMSCIDLNIEKSFQMTILGLGDIIIPGYLVSHCFTMNGFSERSRIAYGLLCSIGYGVGLIVTFLSLILMDTAQPALIYLVPCTLVPICIMAYIKGQLRLMWYGIDDLADPTAALRENEVEETRTSSGTNPDGSSVTVT